MRTTRIVAALALMAVIAASIAAPAADSTAGQRIFERNCAACHQPSSYAGKSDVELETVLKGMVAGTIGHPKKLTLSATDIANVVAYISSAEPK